METKVLHCTAKVKYFSKNILRKTLILFLSDTEEEEEWDHSHAFSVKLGLGSN